MARRTIYYAGIVLTICAPAAAQEIKDFDTLQVIHQETREKAGVEAFHLKLEGDPIHSREKCVARVEIFGMNKENLGNLEIRWPDADTTDVTYIGPGPGAGYHIVGHDDGSPNIRLELEDLTTGQRTTIQHVGPPADRRVYRSREEAMAAIEERQRQSQWIVEGDSETKYQEIAAVVGMMVLEVETALGISPGQQTLQAEVN